MLNRGLVNQRIKFLLNNRFLYPGLANPRLGNLIDDWA